MEELNFSTLPSTGGLTTSGASSSSSGFSSSRSSQPRVETASSSSSSSLVFTLPISCQICLSKVKDPVICSNRHVFCKQCMDVWLQRNKQCPACRVEVNDGNPLRSILGGLSVNEVEDVDDGVDAETSKAARNSKKNLRKARIELLFNEYEEEIEDLREEVKGLKETNGRMEDELRVAKEVATASKKVTSGAATTPRDANTAAMLAGLTAKLQEANDTYLKVLRDMDALKKENGILKDGRENLGFEVSRLRSRLQLRSPAKLGRYATVAMESEVASTRREMERLKKALAQADANMEKMQRDHEHLNLFHRLCRDTNCPLKTDRMKEDDARANSPFEEIAADAEGGAIDAGGRASSALSLPDSPSTTLGLLSLRSPAAASFAASRHPLANDSKCMRNLFTSSSSSVRSHNENLGASSTAGAAPVDDPSTTHHSTISDAAPGPSNAGDDLHADDSINVPDSSFNRFSFPSTSFSFATPSVASTAAASIAVNAQHPGEEEEESEVDVSLEPDVQDCLSLMRAAERKIQSRVSTTNVFVINSPTPTTTSSIADSTGHSRSWSSGTDSTVISLAISSSSSSTTSVAREFVAQADAISPSTSSEADHAVTLSSHIANESKRQTQSLKREISQGDLPSKKNPKL